MPTPTPSDRRQSNRRIGSIAAFAAVAMIGAAYAAVPLYAAFCKATGFAGTTQVARANSGVEGERTLTVRFDANVAPGTRLEFRAGSRFAESAHRRHGDRLLSRAQSRTARIRRGSGLQRDARSVRRVVRQDFVLLLFRAAPGSERKRRIAGGVLLDPRLEQDHTMDKVDAITLSYTLFAPTSASKPVALAPAPSGARSQL